MKASNPNRLSAGGRIDRSRPISFRFDRRLLWGYEGDTLASALLANGITLVSRSFKLHRPRGIIGFGAEDTGGLVQIMDGPRTTPNVRATQEKLVEGLEARSINCWPSARWDVYAVLALFSRLLPAGFYYKTFKWPSWSWYEPVIRRLAGLGTVPRVADPDRYERGYLHCDVLVIGGGRSGLAAASKAAASGADVLLVEEQLLFGHQAHLESRKLVHELRGASNVRLFERTQAFGYYDENLVALFQRCTLGQSAARLYLVRTREVVLATGAIEQPLVFAGNDRPGVMLASAVRAYLDHHAVVPGRRAAIFTNNDDAYQTAFDLHAAGIVVSAIIDLRQEVPSQLVSRAADCRITLYAGSEVIDTTGWRAVRAITVKRTGHTRPLKLPCDLLCVSGGYAPTLHLFSQSGGALSYDERTGCFLPGIATQRVRVIGRALGICSALNEPALPASPLTPWVESVGQWSQQARRSAFVDLMSDVAVSDVELAAREGYVSVEHLKRYTTLGMSPDQGKTSNLNGIHLLGAFTGRSPRDVGTTKFRPPFTPVTLGALAGRSRGALFSKVRRLPTHDLQVTSGAHMEELSGWLRPVRYGTGHSESNTPQEARHVRESAGLMDYSPIGKIEIVGPDSAEFLERIYAVSVLSLRVGHARYGLMLNENGVVIDDGILVRLGEQRFLLTATSGHAEMIADWLEDWHQSAWPELRVILTPVTTNFGTLLISGPQARSILAQLPFSFALDGASFPHMTVREGLLGKVPVRVLRTSFSGEVSFEIYVPWRECTAVWSQIVSAGAAYGLRAFGTDAMLMLRLEKGYVHVGLDTDSTTIPDDIDMGRLHLKKAGPFVGKQALARPLASKPDRLQLVGFEPVRESERLHEGAQVIRRAGPGREGSITSSCVSPTLGRSIALGMLAGGRARHGEIVEVYHNGTRSEARVRAPCFFDPTGERLRNAS